jgi:apolipoprotein N-acyltransferase
MSTGSGSGSGHGAPAAATVTARTAAEATVLALATGARAVLLGAAAGACIALGGAPREWCLLAWLGPGLLLLAIDGPDAAHPRWVGVLAGGACGVATNALAMDWILGLLEAYAGFPLLASLPVGALLWLGQSLPWALAGWLACTVSRSARLPAWLVLPCAIAVAASIAPMLFPWRLGVSQMGSVVYVQCAELGGPPLVDLLMALGSCGALEALRRKRGRVAAVALAAIGLPLAYGWVRLDQVRAERESAELLRVGVVQPNVGIFERMDPMNREPLLALHRDATRALEREGADLVLWPESSYPFPIDRADAEDSRQPHRRIRMDGVRGPVVFGALTHGDDGRFNSVVAMDEAGRFVGTYDKVNLLAFGEYTPFWDWLPPLQWYFPRGFGAGDGPRALPIAGTTLGPMNCYEDLLVPHAQATAALEPGFLANFTNDAWFGDTSAPHLHHMLARMRAVETRRDLVRAVNTGVSGHVLATGEDEHRTRAFARTTFVADVRLLEGTTPWVRWGDLVTPALLGVWLGLLTAHRASRRRSARA